MNNFLIKLRRYFLLFFLNIKNKLNLYRIKKLEKEYGISQNNFYNIDSDLWSDFNNENDI